MRLAQLNIATAKYAMDSPELKDFVDDLDPVNAMADEADGFICRLQDESGDATSIQVFDDLNTIVNMSVWTSVDALKDFVFRTHHRDVMRRKKEWFHQVSEDTYVLWWIDSEHTPTVQEGVDRLMYLRKHGDTPRAFTFKTNYTELDLADSLTEKID